MIEYPPMTVCGCFRSTRKPAD